MGAHVPLELGGRLAVDATQVAYQNAAGGRATEAPRTVLPLLAVVLLGVDTKVGQRGEAAVTEMASVMLGLVVHPHVICDVCSGQQLPTDVAGYLLLVANHVRTQTILRGKTGLTGRAFEGSLRRVHLSDVTVQMVRPGESFATVGADVGFLHASLVGSHMVAHAVLPLEALLADVTGERLLVRVGQAVAVEVVNVTESLPARLAGMVFPYWVWVGI